MFTTSTVIAADLFPLKQRGLVGGVTTGIWAVGGALGGPLGGWVADHWGWRAAFVCRFTIRAIPVSPRGLRSVRPEQSKFPSLSWPSCRDSSTSTMRSPLHRWNQRGRSWLGSIS